LQKADDNTAVDASSVLCKPNAASQLAWHVQQR